MPFKKGVATPGAGRPGYQLEKSQLEKMRKLLDKYIKLAEQGLLDPKEREHFYRMEKLVLKTMDKLHANKQDITSDGKQININIAPEIANQNEL